MANIVLVGGQWGDEGKGKVVDLLSGHFDLVARYSGGPNAGHTVRRAGRTFKLSHIPSGILTKQVACVIGNGTVINPATLFEEIKTLADADISVADRLWISGHAHVILQTYIDWEKEREESATGRKIGTTLRGVGPAYAAKIARAGLRVIDLYHPETLPKKVAAAVGLFAGTGALGGEAAGGGEVIERTVRGCLEDAGRLKPFVTDTVHLLDQKMKGGARVLFEGAQGAMLDIDHGTYPFVTSSSSAAGGACTGLGVSPTRIDGVLGIFKSYTTRVGEGPFPTEDRGDAGTLIRERGREFGTVTGRPRRCGWFDAVAARYAARLNGMDSAALTLLDVLDAFEEIQYCTGYRHRGAVLNEYPLEPWVLAECEPVYAKIKGWMRDTTSCRTFDNLPEQALAYIKTLEDLIECDIDLVSVAATPEGTIRREVSKLSAWLD